MGNYTSKDENLAEQSAIPARIGLTIPPNSPNTTGGNQTSQNYAAGIEDNRFYNSNSNSAQNEDGYA